MQIVINYDVQRLKQFLYIHDNLNSNCRWHATLWC